MRQITTAILHCAAVPTDWYVGKTAYQAAIIIRGWHKENGWKDIGYHFVVMPDGTISKGRPLDQEGAHTQGFNKNSVGILMIETRKIDRMVNNPLDYYTPAQLAAVRGLIAGLRVNDVKGHNDFASKLCPAFKVNARDFLPSSLSAE